MQLGMVSPELIKQLGMVSPELVLRARRILGTWDGYEPSPLGTGTSAKVALWSVDSELPLECLTAQRRRARTGGEPRMRADECGSDARPLDAGDLHTVS